MVRSKFRVSILTVDYYKFEVGDNYGMFKIPGIKLTVEQAIIFTKGQ
jgi:hypothetical protein